MSDECPNCAAANARADRISLDLDNAEMSMRGMRREMARLKGELTQREESSPQAQEIKDLLAYWQTKTGHPKAKVPLTGKRAKCVRARLGEAFTAQDIRKAIDGAARFPFVGAGGRSPEGPESSRYDDLELICRDEVNVGKFMALADRPEGAEQAPVLSPQKQGAVGTDQIAIKRAQNRRKRHERRPYITVLDAIQVSGLEWKENWGDHHESCSAQCPAHEDRSPSLSLYENEKGDAVLHCFAGCQTPDILAALQLTWQDLFADGLERAA